MKWLRNLFLFLTAAGFCGPILKERHAITYEPEANFRTGTSLLLYAHARYLSYMSEIPFLVRPFPGSENLDIGHSALPYDIEARRYTSVQPIDSASSLNAFFRIVRDPAAPPTLFVMRYLPTDITEWDENKNLSLLFNLPWHKKEFKAYLNQSAKPLISVPSLCKEGVLNVAVHIRDGSPTLKSPSVEYHKRQIQKIYKLNRKKPMHVMLFTDKQNLKGIVEEFRRNFQKDENIVFGIHSGPAAEDFFAMQTFDTLIATQSNFSMMAWRMGDFDLVIYPIHKRAVDAEVDRIQMLTRKSTWFPYEINVILRESL